MKNKFLFGVFLLLLSCDSNSSVMILNNTLKSEIISLIARINNNKPCKSDNIVVKFEETKIYVSNSKPVLSIDLIGVCYLNKSKIYFYSKNDYYKGYINIDFGKNNYKIDENYSSGCEPPMGSTLLIDSKNKNILTKWKLK